MIYLDNASTTKLDERVLSAMLPFFSECYGNPSSIHTLGQQSRDALETARGVVSKSIGAKPSEIVFTSSATEAINAALKGCFFNLRKNGKTHILTSSLEHLSVLRTIEWLRLELGAYVDFIHHDGKGVLDLDDFRKKIRPGQTGIVSIMHVNNEIGNENPVRAISDTAKENGICFHCDAVQSVGKVPLDLNEMGVDFLSASGHKFHAPKGIGFLYVRNGSPWQAFIHGGFQEGERRAGTENVAFCAGLAEAMKRACESFSHAKEKIIMASSVFLSALERTSIDFVLNGDAGCKSKRKHILSLTFPSVKSRFAADVFLPALNEVGVHVSTGSACSSGIERVSHVLTALGFEKDKAQKTIRFSFSKFNEENEMRIAAEKVASVVKRLS